ncbi:RNA polymerase sigma factor [Streptomyces sp. NPDC002520]
MDTQGGGAEPWETAAALVRATRHGDALALDELLTLVTPYVTRLCRPIAATEVAAAVQESLVAVFKGMRALRDPLAFYGWVPTVTVREAVRVATRTAVEEPADPADLARRRRTANCPSTSGTSSPGCRYGTVRSWSCASCTRRRASESP